MECISKSELTGGLGCHPTGRLHEQLGSAQIVNPHPNLKLYPPLAVFAQ